MLLEKENAPFNIFDILKKSAVYRINYIKQIDFLSNLYVRKILEINIFGFIFLVDGLFSSTHQDQEKQTIFQNEGPFLFFFSDI